MLLSERRHSRAMTTRRFEFSEGSSNKFWEVSLDGTTVVTKWGRIGTDGQTTLKKEASVDKAQATLSKLIKEKTAKGYVEKSATATAAATPAPAPVKKAGGKPLTVKLGAQGKTIVPLKGGRCAVLDDAKTLTWFDARGTKLGSIEVGDSTTPRADADGHVVIASGGTTKVLAVTGKAVRQVKGNAIRAVPLPGGDLLTIQKGAMTMERADGKTIATLKGGLGFIVPHSRGFMFTEKLSGEEKVLHVVDADGKELEKLTFKGTRHSAPVELADGRVVQAFNDKLVIAPKGKPVKVPAFVSAPVVTSGDTIAVPVEGGLVAIVDAKGRVTTVRRDALGAGENEQRITHADDGGYVLPSLDGHVHHVSASGEFLGSVKLGTLEKRAEIATLDDGTIVVADGKKQLHFLKLAHFGAAKPPEVKDLSKERAELTKHFAPWLATPQCHETLAALLERLVEVSRSGKAMTLSFVTDEQALFPVKFGAPDKKPSGPTKSYAAAVALHGSVVLGDGVPDELQFGDCNMEHDGGDRWIGLCDAGQNWLAFDTKTKNKLGEPSIVLVDHGAGIEDATAYPSQKKQAFGVPGHLLRSIAFRVLENDDRFSEFSWG